MKLSAIVLTFNEEKHIRACLESVRSFADELLVFDSLSTDRTVEIARAGGARIETRKFDNYPGQRNAALEAASGDWIFFIDADERADVAMGAEIRSEISHIQDTIAQEAVLFWIPRKNFIFGKWIRHTGWSPDYQPRVLNKGGAWFDPTRPVHELVVAHDGLPLKQIYLKSPLVHYNYDTLTLFRQKQIAYTKFEAQMMYQAGVHSRRRSFVSMPVREFVRRFISLEGFRDGWHGLALSGLMAYYAFWRQVWLRDMWRGQ